MRAPVPKPVRKDPLGNVLPTGIFFMDLQSSYRVGAQKQGTLKNFKTLQEAKAYYAELVQQRIQKKQEDKQRTMEEKRRDDVQTNGESLDMEREYIINLCDAVERYNQQWCKDKRDRVSLVILNDGTMADVLLRTGWMEADSYMQIQVKTTMKKDEWKFQKVNKYPGMVVLCAALEEPVWQPHHVWMYNGTMLQDEAPACGDILVTDKGKWGMMALFSSKKCKSAEKLHFETLQGLVEISKNEQLYPRVSEAFARWMFRSEDARTEMMGICAFQTLIAGDPVEFLWSSGLFGTKWQNYRFVAGTANFPTEDQGGLVDLHCKAKDVTTGRKVDFRQQFKQAYLPSSQSGWRVSLHTANGHDHAGVPKIIGYRTNAFDQLIVVRQCVVTQRFYFFAIPACAINRNEDDPTRLVTGLTVHLPLEIYKSFHPEWALKAFGKPPRSANKSIQTRQFYIGCLPLTAVKDPTRS
jgi:hypothetical protein